MLLYLNQDPCGFCSILILSISRTFSSTSACRHVESFHCCPLRVLDVDHQNCVDLLQLLLPNTLISPSPPSSCRVQSC